MQGFEKLSQYLLLNGSTNLAMTNQGLPSQFLIKNIIHVEFFY